QALVRVSGSPNGQNGNSAKPVALHKVNAAPLTDELVADILAGRGLRGWLRAARVANVLGLFTLYLFLDTYDIRADFNRRMQTRKSDAAKELWWAGLKSQIRAFALASLDKSIRLLRLVLF